MRDVANAWYRCGLAGDTQSVAQLPKLDECTLYAVVRRLERKLYEVETCLDDRPQLREAHTAIRRFIVCMQSAHSRASDGSR